MIEEGLALDLLFKIQNTSTICPLVLPVYGNLYNIDLNTREIEIPDQDIVVKKDHNSTVFYFTVDRFFNYMDLSTTTCIILYSTKEETFVYPVPFYDIQSLSTQQKMIVPWVIDDFLTKEAGEVTFSFKFYKMEGDISEDAELVYQLNTKTAKLFVEEGIDAPVIELEDLEKIYGSLGQFETEEDAKDSGPLSYLFWLIDEVRKLKGDVYTWTILEDEIEQTALS